MIIDESYFEDDGEEDNSLQKNLVGKQQCGYIPRKCEPEWFTAVQSQNDHHEEQYMLFKFNADLCYYKQQYNDAIGWYKMVLQHLPKTNGQVRREVVDSISRAHLRIGDAIDGLIWAQELIQAPHETHPSSWQLLAQYHMMLNNTQDEVLCRQQSLLYERMYPDHWISLSLSYSKLCNKMKTHPLEKDKLTTIVVRTVNLLRPYYSWKNNFKEETSKVKEEEGTIGEENANSNNTNVKADYNCTEEVFDRHELLKNVFSDLLMRKLPCASVVEKYSLNREKEQKCSDCGSMAEVLCGIFNLAEIACLLVARVLLQYSLKHSSSFVTVSRQHKMMSLQQLLSAHQSSLVDYLTTYFVRHSVHCT